MIKELNKLKSINQLSTIKKTNAMVTIPLVTRKEALKIITQKRVGKIDDLKAEIGESMVKEFELIGYIIRGHSDSGLNTWRASDTSYKTWEKVYTEPSMSEKIISFFLARVLLIR